MNLLPFADTCHVIRATSLILCLTLAACTQFPELDGTVAPDLRDADFPQLVPIEPLLNANAPVVADPIQTTQALDGRIAALRARAAALQESDVVDAETERQLEAARN
ncbi:MAG: hypothetical protein ABJX32_18480 [Tateyamaria sp.]|uniref:hypothetical protein n=1 Tax=Tateyamaria sp. TaxID=1929288 RepID=UPI00329FFEC4